MVRPEGRLQSLHVTVGGGGGDGIVEVGTGQRGTVHPEAVDLAGVLLQHAEDQQRVAVCVDRGAQDVVEHTPAGTELQPALNRSEADAPLVELTV
ncbi:MAG: hypothetical protein ABSA52_21100 [Candidatus Binatia bacterium]